MAKQKAAAESAAAGNRTKRKIRKNDQVVVLAGKNRGARGRVLRVHAASGKAVVEHVNMIKRHTRPNPNQGIQGGILEREAPVQISNLMVICPECGEPSRLGRKRLEDGRGQRVCKNCGATFS
jgi:large subunit ribosomal protein L24